MRRVFGVCVVLLLALGLFPGSLFGQRSPNRDRGSQLSQNYPNPFNPETTIPFVVLPEDVENGPARVSLRIFNVLQQLVAVPTAENHPHGNAVKVENLEYDSPGSKTAFWDGTDRNGRKVASGIYYFQLIVNGERRGVKKMVVTK
ncbi:MAG: FlgD immunoglobulin-like domain containing protein [Gemmatimonadota bacterium]